MTSAATAPRLAGVPLIASATAPAAAAQITSPQLERSLVERVFADHRRALSACDRDQELRGDITVRFKVGASGRISQPQVSTVIKNHEVIACLLRAIQTLQFSGQSPAGAQGSYTLSFP
jgi:outer membrane biosynthesis protein TonB